MGAIKHFAPQSNSSGVISNSFSILDVGPKLKPLLVFQVPFCESKLQFIVGLLTDVYTKQRHALEHANMHYFRCIALNDPTS